MIIDIAQVRKVDIISIDTTLEVTVIRSMLEAFGLQTKTHYIGNVKHLISLLQSPDYLQEIVILCCHGDQEGLLIPELAPELARDMPYHKKLNPENLAEILHLKNQVVINTGCCLGSAKFAESFLAKGAKAYIGATDYIEGNAILLFITNLFYFHVCKNMSLDEAFEKARYIDVEARMFKLWKNTNKKY